MKIVYLVFFLILNFSSLQAFDISPENAKEIGMKIWKNESNQSIRGLCCWNKGEEFASLGIGHFIWYPKGSLGIFEEQFPKLMAYMQQNQVDVPVWLLKCKYCPWSTREEFVEAAESERMKELRNFLASTIDFQIAFMIKRLDEAVSRILVSSSEEKREKVRGNFHMVAIAPNGFYTLLDYLNFKGEGTNIMERYHGQGWGLLQVLENMKGTPSPIRDFSNTAKELLSLRVKNSPPERNESKWLQGWNKRLDSYLNN